MTTNNKCNTKTDFLMSCPAQVEIIIYYGDSLLPTIHH